MANPSSISWTGSNEREDNTPYLPEERRGYHVAIVPDGAAGTPDDYIRFSAISQSYDYTMPLSELANPLTEGSYQVYLQDEDVDGRKSVWSAPIAISWVTANPKPPTGLIAS